MHPFSRRIFRIALLAALPLTLFAAAACGDDDGDNGAPNPFENADNTDDATGNGSATDDGGDNAPSDASAPSADGPGEERAVVTIDGETFEFEMSIVCLSFGGAVGGAGVAADGNVDINIDIPPEDWETSDDQGWQPPSIRIDDDRDPEQERSWRAGGEVIFAMPDLEGISQVDDFSIDGSRATGSATFIDFTAYQLFLAGAADEPEPVSGTFDVSC